MDNSRVHLIKSKTPPGQWCGHKCPLKNLMPVKSSLETMKFISPLGGSWSDFATTKGRKISERPLWVSEDFLCPFRSFFQSRDQHGKTLRMVLGPQRGAGTNLPHGFVYSSIKVGLHILQTWPDPLVFVILTAALPEWAPEENIVKPHGASWQPMPADAVFRAIAL